MAGFGKKVWAPHPTDGYQIGEIADVGADSLSVQAGGQTLTVPYNRVFPADDASNAGVNDNCQLMFLNEASLLHNLRKRYEKDEIYTYTANILIALNPYRELKVYDAATIEKYRGKSLGVLPPHVFAIADAAYRDMKVTKQSQSIIISGESGAGKTESTKYVIRYLTVTGKAGGSIEKRIVQANPLLEAFGNAKTSRNNNSSRFGKFVEIHFDGTSTVAGAFISHYLLEKSRIIKQSPEERNYHVFYRLCNGATEDVKKGLGLGPATSFRYLKGGITDAVKGLDDTAEYKQMMQSMSDLGLSQEEQMNILRVAAAVLHLGNIDFQENSKDQKGGSEVASASEKTAVGAANMIGLAPNDLKERLCSRIMSTARGGNLGTIYRVPLKVIEAGNNRDGLAKALYSRLFDWIVARVNKCFPFSNSSAYIGVLDIAGFEFFQTNSFEQFCINFCNEKLQQYFNEKVLKQEQELYQRESIKYKEISFVDNQDVIDLISGKGGIMTVLDEEAKLPTANDKHFSTSVHEKHGKHFRLMQPRKSKLPNQRKMNDDEGFIVRHYAGAVCYTVDGFLDKNNDALHHDLHMLMQESKDPFIALLFEKDEDVGPEEDAKAAAGGGTKRAKLHFASVGSKFREQLNVLMEKLQTTRANFIRCVKPNLKMQPQIFMGTEILSQLQCAGMVEVLELLQGGFPSRTSFNELYEMYKKYLPAKLQRLDPRTFCEALFRALGMSLEKYQFGTSRVFFKSGQFAEFDKMTTSDPENLAKLVESVMKWLIRKRWRKFIYGAITVEKLSRKIKYRQDAAKNCQRVIRGFLARRKYRPRVKALKRAAVGLREVQKLEAITATLAKDKDQMVAEAARLKKAFEGIKANAKAEDPKKSVAALDEAEKSLTKFVADMRQKKAESDELRRLQEEMERERKRKEEAEAREKALEEERKAKAAMEAERRKAEEEHRKRTEEDAKNQKLKDEQDRRSHEEVARRAQDDQDRRDTELAARLAEDEGKGGAVRQEAAAAEAKRQQELNDKKPKGKHDLSKWKYGELRDAINTSTDAELLEACREEFHRRLKVYHAWKTQHANKSGAEEAERAPLSVLESAPSAAVPAPPPRTVSKPDARPQRYFKIPFLRPQDANTEQGRKTLKRGYWYSHFDGQWIARQLEVHPDRPPVLLVAGKDDMEMCELSLEETGLTRKKGAEITQPEFDDDWVKAGGAPYNPAWSKKN
eukprot:Opistho-2@63822